MTITQRPSPNHSSRLGRAVTLIVTHHTASRTAEGAIRWLCDPESRVSAHYVIARDGAVTQLVPENLSAWHTGPCRWPGDAGPTRSLNRESIGIELVNRGNGIEKFPIDQLVALSDLMVDIRKQHPETTIVRHRDIAWPRGRKTDPSDLFPWDGFWKPAEPTVCPTCNGSGVYRQEHDFCTEELGCPHCEGSGKMPASQPPKETP